MIYIPKHFEAPDIGAMQALMQQAPFATLVSARADDVRISHLPVMHQPAAGRFGRLTGHLARANPHWHWLGHGRHLVIFHGPHTYISPTWYRHHPSVPTWNYTVVHASGPCRLVEDRDELRSLVETLSTRFEGENGTDWTLPDDPVYLGKMMAQIVGFTLDIEDLQGKFKLSQNRPTDDREQVRKALQVRAGPSDRELSELMTSLNASKQGPSL